MILGKREDWASRVEGRIFGFSEIPLTAMESSSRYVRLLGCAVFVPWILIVGIPCVMIALPFVLISMLIEIWRGPSE